DEHRVLMQALVVLNDATALCQYLVFVFSRVVRKKSLVSQMLSNLEAKARGSESATACLLLTQAPTLQSPRFVFSRRLSPLDSLDTDLLLIRRILPPPLGDRFVDLN